MNAGRLVQNMSRRADQHVTGNPCVNSDFLTDYKRSVVPYSKKAAPALSSVLVPKLLP